MVQVAVVLLSLAVPAGGSVLPGYVPQRLSTPVVSVADLRSLVETLALTGDETAASHAALTAYTDALQAGAASVRRDVASIQVDASPVAIDRLEEGRRAVEAARERVEALRAQGVFDGDPSALREAYAEAVEDARRELAEAERDAAAQDVWGDAFLKQAELLEAWFQVAEANHQGIRATLRGVAGEDRAAAFDAWWTSRQYKHMLKRGRLSGARLDPLAELAAAGVEVDPSAAHDFMAAHVARGLAREATLQALPTEAADAVAAGRPARWRRAAKRAIDAREAVRDHALAGARAMLAGVSEDESAAVWLRLKRAAFPGIWRRDHGTRTLKAATALPDLDPAQRGMVAALLEDHNARMEALRLEHLDAVLAEEGRRMVDQDVAQAARFFTEAPPPPGDYPGMQSSAADRQALVRDSLRRLQATLTETQWASLPGTRTQPVRD
jgi:hypothetical protein